MMMNGNMKDILKFISFSLVIMVFGMTLLFSDIPVKAVDLPFVPVQTVKPTKKPAVKATPKPTAKPSVKVTPRPTENQTSGQTSVKAKQKISTAKIKTLKYKSLKKKKVSIDLKAKTSGNGQLSFKVTGYPKNAKKYVTVSSKGKVTLKKKAKKGTYKITVSAKATRMYFSTKKVISIKVK